MDKSAIKILIIDDDATFSEAIRQVVTKAGYQPLVAKTPQDAINAHSLQVFSAYIIDCLLPKINGIDLATRLRAEGAESEPMFLTSGIFKDKTFVKEALQKTQALQFFPKPFDPLELIKALDTALASLVDEPKEPLQELLCKSNATPGEKLSAIKATTTIHGFDLPRVLTLLMLPSVTGKIMLTDSDGKSASLHIYQGRIMRAEVQDRQSFFGALVVEKNYLSHEKLEKTLSQPNPQKKRVGERLIEANVISPHVISVINSDQLGIRLSQLVQDTNYEMRFEESETLETEGYFERPQLIPFLSDWISSKINLEWMKSYYLIWQDNTVTRTDRWSDNHPAFSLPPLVRHPSLVADIKAGTTLSQLLTKYPTRDEEIYGSIHLLLLNDLVFFNQTSKSNDSNVQLNRLQKLAKDMEKKNDFEVLGVSRKSKSPQIKKAYHDLSKAFHPDKLPPGSPTEIVQLTKIIFTRMTAAYNHIADDEKRALYVKELEVGQAEKVLQAESLFEEARSFLKTNQFTKALEKFKAAAELGMASGELTLYTLWAQLASLTNNNTQEVLEQVGAGLNKVAPEDRHNALYYFVKGLYQKHLGEVDSARNNLSHAVAQKPEFMEAKRELHLLNIANKNKPVDLLRGDLKDVVGLIFGKKK